jgi:hypothetical protein
VEEGRVIRAELWSPSRLRRLSGWALVVALVALAPVPSDPASSHAGEGLLRRLLGPVASLAASAQWVRADLAFREGREELGFARAQTALLLDPGAAEGWNFLAWHQGYDLASPEREPDPSRRLAWLRAGMETAARGERVAREPADLALLQGLMLAKTAAIDPRLAWPGGERGMWRDAAEHFERAGSLGAPLGAALAANARMEARL